MNHDFKYETPQYHLIRAMNYAGEASEKASEALNSLIDALQYGVGEYDCDGIRDSAKDSIIKAMSEAFLAVDMISALFAESIAAEEKKGETDGEV